MVFRLLEILVFALTMVPKSYENGFTPPPMSTPPMPAPPSNWDTRDIKYYFRKPADSAAYCNNPVSVHAPYFCDPNKRLSHVNAATIASTLVTARNSTESCVNNSTRGLNVGVAVISKINVISENGSSVYMKPFNQLVRDNWGTMQSACDAAVLLFVSCEDFSMYESLGPNTLNIVEPSCRSVFNLTAPVYNNKSDCFSGLIQPRITAYRQIVDGTHTCYSHAGDSPSSNTMLIVVAVSIGILVLIVLICVAYRFVSRQSEEGNRSNIQEIQTLKSENA